MHINEKIKGHLLGLGKMIPLLNDLIAKRALRQKNLQNWEKTFDAIDDWISIIDMDSNILRSNRAVEKYFNLTVRAATKIKCCKLVHGTDKPVQGCPLPRMIETRKRESAEVKIFDGRWMLITVDPVFSKGGKILSAVHITRDISERIAIQNEKETLVRDLKNALGQIKALSGMIPICSCCKKIRDDKGYWEILESYIESRSDVSFSHGLCPVCTEKLYGKEEWYTDMKLQKYKKNNP